MGKKLKLYHGTIHEFDAVDVTKGKPFKDFGAGFYLGTQRAADLLIFKERSALE